MEKNAERGQAEKREKKSHYIRKMQWLLKWRPQPDLNRCCRRERPIRRVFHLILLAFLDIKNRLKPSKAVKRAVCYSRKCFQMIFI